MITELGNKNPFLFIVGCPRSGTTLLQRMIDAHPEVAVANDTHFIPKVIGHLDLYADPALSDELVDAVINYKRFYRMKLEEDIARNAAVGTHTYSGFVSKLFCEYGNMYDKPLAGEKTPDYVKHIERLHYLFPWSKYIHIIRDGRNVALSVLNWATNKKGPGKIALWNENPIAVCALWWRDMVLSGINYGRTLPNEYYTEVLYEELVSNAEDELKSLSSFLGIEYSDNMVRFYEGKTIDDPNLSAKSAWIPVTPDLRKWEEDMKPDDVELFEAISGDLLTELGYERRFSSVSSKILNKANIYTDWWLSELSPI